MTPAPSPLVSLVFIEPGMPPAGEGKDYNDFISGLMQLLEVEAWQVESVLSRAVKLGDAHVYEDASCPTGLRVVTTPKFREDTECFLHVLQTRRQGGAS